MSAETTNPQSRERRTKTPGEIDRQVKRISNNLIKRSSNLDLSEIRHYGTPAPEQTGLASSHHPMYPQMNELRATTVDKERGRITRYSVKPSNVTRQVTGPNEREVVTIDPGSYGGSYSRQDELVNIKHQLSPDEQVHAAAGVLAEVRGQVAQAEVRQKEPGQHHNAA